MSMTNPIIKTKDLSMDTVVALRDCLKIRCTVELSELQMWEWRTKHVGEKDGKGGFIAGLSEAAMGDIREKYEALANNYTRVNQACREAGR
jgi:hypothetical protein